MKTLLLMRHGKSDWDADYGSDHDRPLNNRGQRTARLMGRLVRGLGLVPDLVVSSSATRAKATAEIASESGRWSSPLQLESGFYGTGPADVLTLASTASGADRLMLVGHQPTWSMIVYHLTGARVDMKTGALACVEMAIDDWTELPAADGILTALHHPRPFFGSQWDDPRGSEK